MPNPIPGFPWIPPDPKPPPSNRKGVWRETIVSWHNAHVHGCLGHRDTWQTTPRCRCIPELTFWSLSRRFFFGSPSQAAFFLGKKNPPSEHTMLLAGTWWSQYSKHLQKPRPEMEHNPTWHQPQLRQCCWNPSGIPKRTCMQIFSFKNLV